MCHDVGAPLTAGPLFYRDRAIGPLRQRRRETGPCTEIRGMKRAQEKRKKQAAERLIQRDGEQENKGPDEKMEGDTDRWRANSDKERDMGSDKDRPEMGTHRGR